MVMKPRWVRLSFLVGLSLVIRGAGLNAMTADDRPLVNANSDRDNWRLHGRTYDNQRFSPLTQINRDTVGQLTLIRTLHTGVNNSFEDTPIEVDGVLYTVTATRFPARNPHMNSEVRLG
jgi:glucose dehydrogenase